MEKISNDTGANKKTGIDYFEYLRNNPEKGRRISKEEFWAMIQKSREEKSNLEK